MIGNQDAQVRAGRLFACLGALLLLAAPGAWSAHPLVTDDTGTQGRRRLQLELTGEHSLDHGQREGGEEEPAVVPLQDHATSVAATLSFGASDSLDAVVSVPLLWLFSRENGAEVSRARGVSDMGFDLKWRFYEREGLSFALKPGFSVPSGSRDRGLGAGEVTGRGFAVASFDAKPLAFHVNAGYVRNSNADGDREDLWHVSAASTVEVLPRLKLAVNLGADRNADPSSAVEPAYLLGGFIVGMTESVDLDFGVKGGLNEAAPDRTFLAGMAVRL